jgi:hypothetical protein
MGDILGGGSNNNNSYEVRGVVESVDTNSRSIFLSNVSGYTSMLSNGGSGSNVRVYYDRDTTVAHQGSTYRPEDLERGDEVLVRVDEQGNSLLAETVTVTRDASNGTYNSGSQYPSSGSSSATLRGTVRYVDGSRRTIEVDRGYNSATIVEFDTQTPVYFNNQTYRATDLERGDEIEIRGRDLGNNRFLATDITVTRNVSGGGGIYNGGSSSSQMSTVRGTVSHVDTSRRTIELESTKWSNGFNSGANRSSRVIVQYPTNAGIDVNGSLQPIAGLERGDVIEVQVQNTSGSTLYAERLWLVRDVRR